MSDHRQELFSRVATHLLTQMEASVSSARQCLYRAGDLRCAVGCLIDDDHYSVELEGEGVSSALVLVALHGSLGYPLSKDDEILLYQLQCIHDGRRPESWLGALIVLAMQEKLSMPEEVRS